MSMSAQPQPRLTAEEYLSLDRAAEFRSEYFDGHMYEKQGGSFRHACIISNLLYGLSTRLKLKGYDVLPPDLRLKALSGRLFAYPDLTVVRHPPELLAHQQDVLLNPTVLVEVLSPESEHRDRGYKFLHYREIESLRGYLLVSQTEPFIEIWRRTSANQWMLSDCAGMDAACRFDSLDCEIPLAEIYYQISFDPQP
jgi:Uma2 family endonuclease